MKNKFIFLLLGFLTIISFVGYTFAQQEDNYTNSSEGFSFKIPLGWSISDNSPGRILLSNTSGSASIEVDAVKGYFKNQQDKERFVAENKTSGADSVIYKGYQSFVLINEPEHLFDRRGNFPTDNPNDEDLWLKKCSIIKENDLFTFTFQAKSNVYDKYSADFAKFQDNFEFLERQEKSPPVK